MSKFSDNYDSIDWSKPTGRKVSAQPSQPAGSSMLQPKFKPFLSPIDQTVISDPSGLRAHNKRHGVTDARDYPPEYIEKRARDRVNAGQAQLKHSRHQDVTKLVDTILRQRH